MANLGVRPIRSNRTLLAGSKLCLDPGSESVNPSAWRWAVAVGVCFHQLIGDVRRWSDTKEGEGGAMARQRLGPGEVGSAHLFTPSFGLGLLFG